MATVHDKYVVELAEVIKGYGNPPDVNDPFCLSEFYRFYEIPNVCVSAENFKKMRPLSDFTEENEARVEKAISCAESYVRTMPSAQPRPKGQWLPDNRNYYEERFVCSVCRKSYEVDTCMGEPTWDFCPGCGADMREVEQDD